MDPTRLVSTAKAVTVVTGDLSAVLPTCPEVAMTPPSRHASCVAAGAKWHESGHRSHSEAGRTVAADDAKTQGRELVDILGAIARDATRLAAQHGQLLREELREGLGHTAEAAATVGAGAGLVAVGGLLGSLMLAQGLSRATRLPLWGCYGIVGGLMGAIGVGLIGSGARRAATLKLLPTETIAALRDDLQWIKNQTETRTS